MAGINKRYYRAKAKEWTMSEASTGKPMLVVLFDVLTEGADVKALTWRGFFTEATMDRTIEAMRHMGFEGDDLGDLTGLDRLEVDLVVEDEEYTDETSGEQRRSNCSEVKPASSTADTNSPERAAKASLQVLDPRPERTEGITGSFRQRPTQSHGTASSASGGSSGIGQKRRRGWIQER
jgi:hypothetical protein